MSGCPVRQVRHVYKNRTGGPITNYSTIGGVCKLCISSFPPPPPPTPPGPPPPPPPPPPHTILIDVGSNGITTLSPFISDSDGTYAVDNGVPVAFSSGTGLNIDINVSPNSKVYINSPSMNTFGVTNYPIVSLSIPSAITLFVLTIINTNISGVFDVSNITDLSLLQLTNNFITGVTGLNLSLNASSIIITDTNINQTAADSIANQINAAGRSNGSLDISTQKTGTINITGAIYNTLRGKNWTIS